MPVGGRGEVVKISYEEGKVLPGGINSIFGDFFTFQKSSHKIFCSNYTRLVLKKKTKRYKLHSDYMLKIASTFFSSSKN